MEKKEEEQRAEKDKAPTPAKTEKKEQEDKLIKAEKAEKKESPEKKTAKVEKNDKIDKAKKPAAKPAVTSATPSKDPTSPDKKTKVGLSHGFFLSTGKRTCPLFSPMHNCLCSCSTSTYPKAENDFQTHSAISVLTSFSNQDNRSVTGVISEMTPFNQPITFLTKLKAKSHPPAGIDGLCKLWYFPSVSGLMACVPHGTVK